MFTALEAALVIGTNNSIIKRKKLRALVLLGENIIENKRDEYK